MDGLVLAGGRSRRFGSDKRLARFHGEELVRLVFGKLLSVVGGTVFVATGSRRERLPGLQRAVVLVDESPGKGPVGGLAAGLRHSRAGVLVIACDLPLVRRTTLERIAKVARTTDRPVALRGPGGWEPLVAWYPKGALAAVKTVLGSARPAPYLVLERLGALALPIIDPAELVNVNTPPDLDTALRARSRWCSGERLRRGVE